MDNLRVPPPDETGSIVKTMFQEFLLTFKGNIMNDNDNLSIQETILNDYEKQMEYMIDNNLSTIYVNFNHIKESNPDLSEAIELEFYRFEIYLRYALQQLGNIFIKLL